MFALFKGIILKPKESTSQVQATVCYMTLHSNDYDAFPIQDVLKGKWNQFMKKGIKIHPIYKTQAEAMIASVGSTRPGNTKGAYILEIGYSSEQAALLIQDGQFNKIIRKAVNYLDLATNKLNANYLVEVIQNDQFDSTLFNKVSNLTNTKY